MTTLGDRPDAAAPGQRRPGGRTARNRAAIFEATVAQLALHGFAELSFDAIATQAGVHKTTIYRRWRTREQLVAAAFMDAAQRRLEVIDSGNIDRDARALARSVAATLAQPVMAAAVRATLSLSSPAVRDEITGSFWGSRLTAVGPLIVRAVERGQLPVGTAPADLIAAIAAPLYFRLLISGEPLNAAAADQAATAALAAARAGAYVHHRSPRSRGATKALAQRLPLSSAV
jgi:AcrR family transcriptional regulator